MAPVQADAITFTGGVNRLTITATSIITGNVAAFSTADTFGLGGDNNATFDASQLGAAGSTAQYKGFGILQKSDTSTWTLNATAGTTLAYQVLAGTLDLGGTSQTAASVQVTGGTLSDGTLTSAGLFDMQNGTVGAVLAGTGALTKSTGGTVTLSGANTYSGGTMLTAGTLVAGVATVGTPDAITSSAIGTGTLTFDGGRLRAGGAYTLANAAMVNTTGGMIDTNNDRLTLSGIIGGSGALAVVNSTDTSDLSGVLALTGVNTYAGGTTVTSSVVEVSNSNVVGGAVQSSSIGTGTLTLASDTTGSNGPSAQLRATANNLTLGNSVVLGGNNGGAFDTGTNTLTIIGQISGGGSGTLQKLGLGTLVLANTNSYTGATQVTAGTLRGGATDAFGVNSPVYLANGATVDLGGYDQAVGSLGDFNGLPDGSSRVINNGAGLATLAVGDSGFSQTLTGAIADGTGRIALTKVGTGTQTLAGQNTYSGATTVTGGALKAGAANALSPNSALLVGAVGMLDIGGFAQTIASLAGAAGATVTNSGTAAAVLTTGGDNTSTTYAGRLQDGVSPLGLVKVGIGTFTLTGANTFTSGTHVEGGTLALGNAGAAGTGDVSLDRGTTLAFSDSFTVGNNIVFTQPGDPMIDTGNNTDTLTGVISGPGDLDKLGAGTLVLAGVNTYTGATIVSAGTLLVTGSAAASTATVDSGGTIGGSGTIGGLVVQAGGTVAPGAATPYSTLKVAGNVTFNAGSTYAVNITPAGQTDGIAATGTTTLNGGTVTVNGGSGVYSTSAIYPILTATGGRTGTFANLTTTTNLAFLTPTLTYTTNAVDLTLTRTVVTPPVTPATPVPPAVVVSFPSVATTQNQRATAGAIEALGTGSLYDTVLSQTAAGARAAFDATSGEIHASAVTGGIEETRLERDAIFDRLDEAARTPVPGTSPFGNLVPVLPRGAQGYAAVGAVPTPAPSAYTAWGTGFGDFGRNGGNGNSAKLDRALGGFVLGLDTRIDGPVLTNWRVGVVGGYTDDQLTLRNRGSSGSFETYFGGLYAGALYGAWDIKLGALGGGTTATTNRSVAFPGFFEAERSDSGGTIAQGFGEVGYRIATASGFVEPIVQGAAIHIGQSGFREGGGAAALVGLAHDTDVQTTTLGAKAEAALPVAGLPLIARGLVGWRHAFGDVSPLAVEAFAAGGPTFTVAGAPIAREAVVADVGLDYRLSAAATLGVSYDGQAGARANDNAVKGALEVRF